MEQLHHKKQTFLKYVKNQTYFKIVYSIANRDAAVTAYKDMFFFQKLNIVKVFLQNALL